MAKPTLQSLLDATNEIIARLDAFEDSKPSRRELLDRIEELEAENEDLQSRLDEIGDICDEEEDDPKSEAPGAD